MSPAFHPYGPSHQAVLVITLLVFVGMLVASRTRFRSVAERMLGGMLLSLYPVGLIVHGLCGSLSAQTGLPLQYCDVATIAGGIALWTKRQFWCEVVYFFGIAGTLQGLLTPALIYEFPDPRFFMFFLMHGGVPITSFYVVTAMKHRPQPGAVKRMMLFSVSWYAGVAVVNAALRTNYAFQCVKPVQASLFDQLGPWPWYNLSTIGLGVVFYSVLYLPFAFRKRPA
ncbi:TIGR02206 family membrane protein [Prosthecobacter sp.]|uniref:YwaF family protein n=1 Tax=Prosthecobacter sp. TaxID=1965333 RepID=UPI001D30ABFC|nr:TIGR02206 family membrane protein [Prosthecobacter sp.]MCB1277627.1 TIGR02206 family membrane protein [Prosthecobacter sp.]